jgi:hypothetical protein
MHSKDGGATQTNLLVNFGWEVGWKDDRSVLARWVAWLGVRFRTLLGTEEGNHAGREFSLGSRLME